MINSGLAFLTQTDAELKQYEQYALCEWRSRLVLGSPMKRIMWGSHARIKAARGKVASTKQFIKAILEGGQSPYIVFWLDIIASFWAGEGL